MTSSHRTAFLFLGSVLSAAAGQFLLAQAGTPFTWAPGLALFGLCFYFLKKVLSARPAAVPQGIPRTLEASLFLGFMLLAAFFRLHGEAPLPDGVFADRAEVALGALGILHEGWRPFLSALHLHVPELPIYYLAAGWFALFGSSPESFARFDAALSLAGLAFFYGAVRLTAGPRAALLCLFLLSVMRWNFVFGRQIYFQTQTVLFTGLTLFLLLLALRQGRGQAASLWASVSAVASGAAASLALYSYQALKVLPVFLAGVALHGFLFDRKGFRKQAKAWTLVGVSFLLVSIPYLWDSFIHQALGRRESEVAVTRLIQEEGSLRPLLSNLLQAAGMFNRRGDDNSQSNYDARRMLDDGTGVLFLLGLLWALTRWRERPFFMGFWGLAAFSLPAVLSINGAHAGRMLGTTPFVALLAALLLRDLAARVKSGTARARVLLCLCFLGSGIAWLNYRDYFQGQALDTDYRNDFSWAESRAGRLIREKGEGTEFFLVSRFFGHPTVRYLALSQQKDLHPLDLSSPPRPGDHPAGRAFQFLLDERKAGVVAFLSLLYPGGTVEGFTNPTGTATLFSYRVEPSKLAPIGPSGPKVERGLKGTYQRMDGAGALPFLERWDPVVNFTFRDLPGLPAPLRVRWSGKFKVEKGGAYSLLLLTYEDERLNQASLQVDGKGDAKPSACPRLEAVLSPGWHDLVLEYQKPEGVLATVNLLWKGPGMEWFEFMPNSAFGPVRGGAP